MESMQGLCAIRGNLVYALALGQLTTLSPGYIITRDGLVEGVLDRLPPHWGGEVVNYGDAVITPGFCDMHLHAPQFPMLGLGKMCIRDRLDALTYAHWQIPPIL